jgi:hypothetical protein
MAQRTPLRRAISIIGRTPLTGRTAPSSASSPTSRTSRRRGGATAPSAASSPIAVARSYDDPVLRRLAGAMLMVIRRSHLNAKPQLRSAARMRPSLSLIEESGSPSIVKRGKPDDVSASTRMRCASAPTTAAVNDVASMGSPADQSVRR